MADGLGAIVFTELHLLQRVVFAIGAALFVAAIIAPRNIGFGLGLIFFAVSYNLFFDFILNRNIPLKEWGRPNKASQGGQRFGNSRKPAFASTATLAIL